MALFKGNFAEYIELKDAVAAARPGSRAAARRRRGWIDSWSVDVAGFTFTAIVMTWVVLSGCGAREHVEEAHVVIHATQPPVVTPIEAPAVAKPVVVRFLASSIVRKAPHGESAKLGVIGKDTRTVVLSAATGEGCKSRWLEIAPRGWVCETAVGPSSDEPTIATPFTFDTADDGPLVPGVYGVVRGAEISTSVRAAGRTVVDGVAYWRTTDGRLVAEDDIVQEPARTRSGSMSIATSRCWSRTRASAPSTRHWSPPASGIMRRRR